MAYSTSTFDLDQGATFSKQIQYKDCNNVNLFANAVSAESEVRLSPTSNTVLATMNCVFSTVTSNNDTLTISIDDITTSTLPTLTPLKFDVKVTWPTHEDFVLRGVLIVHPTVTR